MYKSNREITPNSSEIERLKTLINQEEQLRYTAEQSYNELLSTSRELEKRMILIDEESNEWKTRYENQEEINRQLTKQVSLLENKLEETRSRSKNIRNKLFIENNKEKNTPEYIKELQKSKESLLEQMKDYSWRIESENKAFHKANEERKDIHQEILDIRNQLSYLKERSDSNKLKNSVNNDLLTSRKPNDAQRSSFQSTYLPSNQTSNNYRNEPSPNEQIYDTPIRKSQINLGLTSPIDSHRSPIPKLS